MAAGATYEPIATYTLASPGTFTFTSIPGTYTDLRLVLNYTQGTSSSAQGYLNNDNAGTSYSRTILYGDGTSAASTRTSSGSVFTFSPLSTSTIPVMVTFDFFNYASTSVYKTFLTQASADQNGSGRTASQVLLWRSTAAITQIDLYGNGTFATGTTATLYGIKAA